MGPINHFVVSCPLCHLLHLSLDVCLYNWLPCLQKMKICIVSCGNSHVIFAVSCVLTYITVFQIAITNRTGKLRGLHMLETRYSAKQYLNIFSYYLYHKSTCAGKISHLVITSVIWMPSVHIFATMRQVIMPQHLFITAGIFNSHRFISMWSSRCRHWKTIQQAPRCNWGLESTAAKPILTK